MKQHQQTCNITMSIHNVNTLQQCTTLTPPTSQPFQSRTLHQPTHLNLNKYHNKPYPCHQIHLNHSQSSNQPLLSTQPSTSPCLSAGSTQLPDAFLFIPFTRAVWSKVTPITIDDFTGNSGPIPSDPRVLFSYYLPLIFTT